MHHDLVQYWIRTAALLVTPIAPHFSEHIWTAILKNPQSIQLALWPTPSDPVDRTLIEAGQYIRGTIKTIRDAEVSLLKAVTKAKGKKTSSDMLYDPQKPKAVRIYVSTTFPEWQDTCVQIIKEAYSKEEDKVDDAKIKRLLTERQLIKDKRPMPFIQAFKVGCILPPPPQGIVADICFNFFFRNACRSTVLKQPSAARCPSPRASSFTSSYRIWRRL
jgi:leucyl-tRNA synthetase